MEELSNIQSDGGSTEAALDIAPLVGERITGEHFSSSIQVGDGLLEVVCAPPLETLQVGPAENSVGIRPLRRRLCPDDKIQASGPACDGTLDIVCRVAEDAL